MTIKAFLALLACLITIAAVGVMGFYKIIDPLVAAPIALAAATAIGGLFKQFKFAWSEEDKVAHKASQEMKAAIAGTEPVSTEPTIKP